jgi:hypothetical protein
VIGYLTLGRDTTKSAPALLLGLLMVVVIVGMDLLFFRDRFWERLMLNAGLVLIFGALYLRFLR